MKLKLLLLSAALSGLPLVAAEVQPTFHKDVERILQRHCQSCHRPGQVAPMSLLTYEQSRPWAKAIRSAVLQKKMPPWFADPHFGKFANERSLTKEEIDTLVRWADQGAPQGDAKDAPAPLEFAEGWRIGKPDVVFELPKAFNVPLSGEIDYQYIMLETGFTEDKWVKATEIMAGDARVVHHAIASARLPRKGENVSLGDFFNISVDALKPRNPAKPNEILQFIASFGSETVAYYVPGGEPMYAGDDQARLIKAGSIIMFQLHYTPIGEAVSDRTKVGLVFADKPPKQRIKTLNVQNFDFSIPAEVDDYPITARAEVKTPFTITSLTPHMHLRGKSFEYTATYPDGRVETLLRLPRWDFNWQLTYYLAEPKPIPVGTILQTQGLFDNSPNNPYNPDSKVVVSYGEQSWDEMMGGLIEVTLDPKIDSAEILGSAPKDMKTENQARPTGASDL